MFSEFIYLFLLFVFCISGEKSVLTERAAAAAPLAEHSDTPAHLQCAAKSISLTPSHECSISLA